MVDFIAKKSAVFVQQDRGTVTAEVVLEHNKVYAWPTKTVDGKPDHFRLNILRDLLAADLIQFVDNRPIDDAYVRSA